MLRPRLTLFWLRLAAYERKFRIHDWQTDVHNHERLLEIQRTGQIDRAPSEEKQLEELETFTDVRSTVTTGSLVLY